MVSHLCICHLARESLTAVHEIPDITRGPLPFSPGKAVFVYELALMKVTWLPEFSGKSALRYALWHEGTKNENKVTLHTQNNFHKAPLSHHSKTVFFSQMPSQSIALDITVIVDKTFLIILIFSYSNTDLFFELLTFVILNLTF